MGLFSWLFFLIVCCWCIEIQQFVNANIASCNFTGNFFSHGFLVVSLRFSMYHIMSSVNNDSFISFFSNLVLFISCLNAVSNTMLNKIGVE